MIVRHKSGVESECGTKGLAVHNISLALVKMLFGLFADTANDKFLIKSHLGSAVAILQLMQVVVHRLLRHVRHYVVQNFQFASRKNAVEELPHANHDDQHEREQNRRHLEGLNDPKTHETRELDQSEEVNTLNGNLMERNVNSTLFVMGK